MTLLSQHAFKNKTPQQLDLFAEVTSESSGESEVVKIISHHPKAAADTAPIALVTPAADPLIGATVRLPNDLCKCGSDIAVVGTGTGTHRARLQCRSCGRFRGWLSKFTADWIEAVAAKCGGSETTTIKAPKL